MEIIINKWIIGKIMFCILNVESIIRWNYFPLKHTIDNRTKHLTVSITQNLSTINMWCIYWNWTVIAINLVARNLFLWHLEKILFFVKLTTKLSLNVLRSLFNLMWKSLPWALNFKNTFGSLMTDRFALLWLAWTFFLS